MDADSGLSQDLGLNEERARLIWSTRSEQTSPCSMSNLILSKNVSIFTKQKWFQDTATAGQKSGPSNPRSATNEGARWRIATVMAPPESAAKVALLPRGTKSGNSAR